MQNNFVRFGDFMYRNEAEIIENWNKVKYCVICVNLSTSFVPYWFKNTMVIIKMKKGQH
jgi:hypothetical protein